MKKLLFALPLMLSLGACATFDADLARLQTAYNVVTTATVPATTAQVAVSSFEVVEAASTEYFKYCKNNLTIPACAAGTVDNPGPLRLTIKYVRSGRQARDQIKFAGKNQQLISSTVYNVLVTAVTNLSAGPVSSFGGTK